MATAPPLQLDPELTHVMRTEGKPLVLPQSEALDQLSSCIDKTETHCSSGKSRNQREEIRDVDTKLSFDPAILRAKYDAERDKRLAANPTGLDQYVSVDNQDSFFRKYLDDPYIQERIQRGPICEETDVLIIGGGFGGQLVAARLVEQSVTDIKILEKGGDFGGTWYRS